MPNSPTDPHPSADSLRAYLADVLPHSQLTIKPVDGVHQPLLLLQTNHVLAGFAFSNGDMSGTYDALYRTFKTYFTQQRGIWDALDLAFVFCVQPGLSDIDEFCSTVETDVYFCRKFVIPLASPPGPSLARLPFLPLVPLNAKTLRPASAQTFLQQCGVPATLAKYIVVQRERAPEGIVEDCIGEEFGAPKDITPVAHATVVQSDASTELVRLSTITMKNFRAYRKAQTFSFGADVTILYGPNGFGKTSFFDAVDFAVTGGIGRLDLSSDAHFNKTAQHLDTGSEESAVSLSFQCNEAVRKITRSVGARKQPILDGRQTDRKTILAELTGRDIPPADRIENLIDLFRATHLFNQEQQELTRGFQNDCCLPAEIVSRMLAFQDYANAVNKATKVREVLESIIASANKEVKELSDQIADEKQELDRLRSTTNIGTSTDTLDAEFEALRSRLATAGFDLDPGRPDPAKLRGWRASIEARRGESTIRGNRLAGLAEEVASLPRLREEIASAQQQILEKEQALGTAEQHHVAAEPTVQRAEKHRTEMNAKCAEAQAKSLLLEWVRATKPEFARLIETQRVLGEEVNNLNQDVAQLRLGEERTASELSAQNNQAEQAKESLKAKRVELAAVQRVTGAIPSWDSSRTRRASIVDSETAQRLILEALHADEREASLQLASVQAEEARLSRQVIEADKGQSEIKTLLSQLQGHVRTGTCPLCGEDHGSRDELIRRIQNHLAEDAASGARTELGSVREKLTKVTGLIADNKQKQQVIDGQLALMNDERTSLDAQIAQFSNSVADLGIDIESDTSTLVEQLNLRLRQVQEEVNELTRQVQDLATTTEAARTALTNAKTRLATKTAEESNRKEALTRCIEETGRLQSDPRMAQVSIEIDDEELSRNAQLNLDQLAEFRIEASKAETELTQKKAELSTLGAHSTVLKAQLQTLRAQLASLQRTVTQILGRIQEAELLADISQEMLLSLVADEAGRQSHLLELQNATSNLEMAIDAATTAAALTTLQQNVRNKEKASKAAEKKRDQHQPWLAYFTKLSRLISSQQNDAIASFTSEYGPRTSVIQRRLRSVYGFDEVDIQSHESTIRVRVKRRGEELRPTDFFSQSQQQTLLLALFLTACISQTWSGFAPVFMDDPVTHFDDLNTYAFLDLIVGLLDSDFGKRQFIISTCDEKLLQLARQKFRHLGDRAVFYRFDAIGADGPIVEKVSS